MTQGMTWLAITVAILIAAWSAWRVRLASAAASVPKPRHDPVVDWYVPPAPMPAEPEEETLRRRLTIEQAEAEAGPGWERLKAAMQPDDELWRFRSPAWTWRARCGRAGVALVRDGEIVTEAITLLN